MEKITKQSLINIYLNVRAFLQRIYAKDIWVFVTFLCFYAILLFGAVKGLGQYWDWSFPYYQDQVKNVFWNYAFSWLGADTGAPLPYMSDYYVRMIFSLFGFLPPELFRYGLVVTLLALISFGVYKILQKSSQENFILLYLAAAFAAVLNPLIFYKLLAGHVNYLISLTIFIYLIYFMFFVFQNTKRRYGLLLSLFFAFIGAQIQFFVFALLFLFVFFLVYKEKRSIQAVLFVFVISFLINLPWLSNFLVGGIHISQVSEVASKASFKDLALDSYKDILNMTFSKATLIDRFYDAPVLTSFSSLCILLLIFVLVRRGSRVREIHSVFVLMIFALLCLELSTFMFADLYYGKVLLPMFREFGHLGPVVLLFLVLSLAQWPIARREKMFLAVLLGVFILANIPAFAFKLPRADFSMIREKFAEFKKEIDTDSSSYRILTYPFFSPYSFNFLPKRDGDKGILLRNAGHDSFMTFSGKSRISNLVPAHTLYNSPQYLLKKSLNLDVLNPYNVKYIFDMTGIYTSEYTRYISNEVVKNNMDVFNQDPSFFDRLMHLNPGRLRKVSENVYSVQNASGNVFAFTDLYCIKSTEWNSIFEFQRLFGAYGYATRGNCDSNRQSSIVNLSELTRRKNVDTKSGTLRFETGNMFAGQDISLYTARNMQGYYAILTNGTIRIYTRNKGNITINDIDLLQANSNSDVASVKTERNTRYYIYTQGKILGIPENVEIYIGAVTDIDELRIFKEGKNLLSRELTPVAYDPNNMHILAYDYRGVVGGEAGHVIRGFENDQNMVGDTLILDESRWNSYLKIYGVNSISSTKQKLKFEFKDGNGIEYQNKKFSVLVPVASVPVDIESGYIRTQLRVGDIESLKYNQPGYTLKNVIQNGNFENGVWNKDVSICHKNSPLDTFKYQGINKEFKTDGSNSLELRAKRNVVCAKNTFPVTSGGTYVLTFDYWGTADKASFRIDYDDPGKTQFRDSRATKRGGWNTYEKNIQVPVGATSATVYLFSRGSESDETVVNLYDKVSLIELPNIDRSMYVVGKRTVQHKEPAWVSYKEENPAKTTVTVTQATDPFYLGFSEAYHPDWKLRPAVTKGGISANPMHTAGVFKESDHYRINEYFNAWYVDPVTFCTTEEQSCIKHPDGTYDIRLVIEFWPQRWFVIFLSISFLTLLICFFSIMHAYHLDHIDYGALFRRKPKDIL
ncbi:MAG: hypothetical protein FGM57_00115 [Candidatus Taylorbacteria bacterium]|nr:hypothetical protein [Candidatus Taylorbacteria bacterium]